MRFDAHARLFDIDHEFNEIRRRKRGVVENIAEFYGNRKALGQIDVFLFREERIPFHGKTAVFVQRGSLLQRLGNSPIP